MPKLYIVTRDCCTSRNCDHCTRLPRGTTVRVEHIRTLDEKVASKVLANWKDHHAALITTETE